MVDRVVAKRAALLREELTRSVRIILSQMQPRLVLLFGSLATGRVGEWSDLDLVIVAETTLPFYDRIKDVIRQVRPKVGMDILVYTPQEWDLLAKESAFVREEIIGKGRVLYERPDCSLA